MFAPAGQSTQLIVGATADNDRHILHLTQSLYEKYRLKRVFYSAYVPVVENSLLPSKDTKPPLLREHRLYQADWLLRFYGFRAEELLDEQHPDFNPLVDPKCHWAIGHLEQFPLEIMNAEYETLLRVPGIGPISARRIVSPPWYAAVRGPEKTGGGAEEGAVLYHLRRPDAAGPAIYRPDPSAAIRGDGARAAAAGRVPAAVTV